MIRARLLHSWPGLSHYFGINPFNYRGLTYRELNEYLTALKDIQAAAREAARPRR